MNTERNDALEQANAQMSSVREMVACLELDWGRLEELREELANLKGENEDCAENYNDMAQDPDYTEEDRRRALVHLQESETAIMDWMEANGEELADLEATAGDEEDRDGAEQRIQEDALSVETRTDWTLYGDTGEPHEFRIVLCTGGPHVQIRGILDDNGEPVRAWLEYQGWGTPLTERINNDGDQDALLTYAGRFIIA